MGPYDTEQQAAAEPMPRKIAALHNAGNPGPRVTYMAKLEALHAACADAQVDLGRYDWQIVEWLAEWEPTTVQAIIGIISRANRGGQGNVPGG